MGNVSVELNPVMIGPYICELVLGNEKSSFTKRSAII